MIGKGKARLTISLPIPMDKDLDRMAIREDRSKSKIIERLIREYLPQLDKLPIRDALRQDPDCTENK